MDTVTLKYPVKFQGEEVTSLTIRRPKMRDLKKMQGIKDEMEKAMTLIADLAEVDPKFVGELDPDDFKVLSDKVGEYMGASADQTP
ncbi:MAG: phage tail assembly protein [Paenirhodobacter sp.]|uniref:phage tail assembly protein n=1 Tax=Paenirhodobacter sp. TaxID=1965326 RepID=UPI003D0AE156